MPRNGMLALVLLERFRPSTMTSNSPDAIGVCPWCTTPGACAIMLSWSRVTTLLSSAPAPSRSTMATSLAPEPSTVCERPCPSARKNNSTLIASATATTLAIDIAARCGIERTFIEVTAPTCLKRDAMRGCLLELRLAAAQRFDNVHAISGNRRQQAGDQPEDE